jgi:hypothetical protein
VFPTGIAVRCHSYILDREAVLRFSGHFSPDKSGIAFALSVIGDSDGRWFIPVRIAPGRPGYPAVGLALLGPALLLAAKLHTSVDDPGTLPPDHLLALSPRASSRGRSR